MSGLFSFAANALEQAPALICALRTMMNHDWCSQEKEKVSQMAQTTKEA